MKLQSVKRGGPAWRAGLRNGMELVTIDGEPILDFIDWDFFVFRPELTVRARTAEGEEKDFFIRNPELVPIGMDVDADLYPQERHCANRCLFCFIDQLPEGLRESLYWKDDDWRYSLMFGNYVSLTNISDRDFHRIIRRHVSPLYISVHATDPETRIRLLRNPRAGRVMEQLQRLGEGGIEYHCQVVLCPGINDGEILEKTVRDVMALRPHAVSLAVVPLGMTCHRQKLEPLTPMSAEVARSVIEIVERYAAQSLEETGSRFVYASDEMYGIAGLPWPRYGNIEEGSPQWGNGIGMFDLFFQGLEEVWEDLPEALDEPRRVTLVTGVAAGPTMKRVAERLMKKVSNLTIQVIPVVNHFFGESIDVAGLLTGGDMANALAGKDLGEEVLIPDCCVKRDEPIFLDDMSVEELAERLGVPVTRVYDEGGDLAYKAVGWVDAEVEYE